MPKALFDHCAPDQLKGRFEPEVKVNLARKHGLETVRNSELEKKAHELGYDALITVDTDFGKPGHPEHLLPVFLLRAFPILAEFTLSVLVYKAKKDIIRGAEPGLYIWDNYRGRIRASRSLRRCYEIRRAVAAELEAEIEAMHRRSR